jgi:hypothetical protein
MLCLQLPLLTDDVIERAANPAALLPAGHAIGASEPTPLFRCAAPCLHLRPCQPGLAPLCWLLPCWHWSLSWLAGTLATQTPRLDGCESHTGPASVRLLRHPRASFFLSCSKITDEEVAQLRARFAGSQADRTAAAAAAAADGAASSSSAAAQPRAAAAAGINGGNSGGQAPTANGSAGAADGGTAAGGKKGKAAADGGAAASGSKQPDRPADIARLDLRVGFIRKAWRIENSK